jgi:hypothetical protein
MKTCYEARLRKDELKPHAFYNRDFWKLNFTLM